MMFDQAYIMYIGEHSGRRTLSEIDVHIYVLSRLLKKKQKPLLYTVTGTSSMAFQHYSRLMKLPSYQEYGQSLKVLATKGGCQFQNHGKEFANKGLLLTHLIAIVTQFAMDKMHPLVYAGDVEIPSTTTINTTRKSIFSNDSVTVLDDIKNNNSPMAIIIPVRTELDSTPAPFMAASSSTGPNKLKPNILKPDITAPGLQILAAWSEGSLPTTLPDDGRVVKYNILLGTSMSCPHIAAAAALVKAIRPNWSSAAIRSVLMTTAGLINNMGTPITDAIGNIATSGHFRPAEASDPGLVYVLNTTTTSSSFAAVESTTLIHHLSFLRSFPLQVILTIPHFQLANLME